jgi:hypothetical protein
MAELEQSEAGTVPESGAAPRGALALALSRAQAAFPVLERSRKVTVKTKDGRSYEFAYAPLEKVFAAIRSPLAENELALVQVLDMGSDGEPLLRTTLIHSSGEEISGAWPLELRGLTPQQIGSALTYARRYAVQALLGVSAEEDDDANAAEGHETTEAKPKPKPKRRQKDFQAPASKATSQQLDEITSLGDRLVAEEVTTWATMRTALSNRYGTDKIESLSEEQAGDLIERLKKRVDDAFDAKVY